MSQRCIGSLSVACASTFKPAPATTLLHPCRGVSFFASPHTNTQLNSTSPKQSFFTFEEAKTTQNIHFRRLRELEAVSLSFERRRDAAKVKFAQAAIMDTYKFPDYRLKKSMDDPSKTPLLLVACGSFSPITFLHLRMFIMAGDYVKFSTDFEIVGGYLSPVSDAYKKAGLASAEHR